MFFIFGTKFVAWGSEKMMEMTRCNECGTVSNFTNKKGMRFITLFFILPIIPISKQKQLIECPNCKSRYETI